MREEASESMQDYLKNIYLIIREKGGSVSTSELAKKMRVSPPTVTSMLIKLGEKKFVKYEKYKGVKLAKKGEIIALEVLRHHRLIETYLVEHLDYDWSEVHEEADILEHHISEKMELRIANALGNPKFDPHGAPIPSADLSSIAKDETTRLGEHISGDIVVIERVREREKEELQYLARIGMVPGKQVEVESVAPFGMVTLINENGTHSLPKEIAMSIHVKKI
jgi:DtxR family Mn-dependent transcriptional regulator